MRPERAWALGVGLVAPFLLIAACGSRTGLPIPERVAADGAAPGDALVGRDVHHGDDGEVDAGLDAIPPLDAQPTRDVNVDFCRDAGATLIYTVTETNALLRFDPPTGSFTRIGTLACNDPNGFQPFSMAVDRQGIAWVLYATFPTGGVPPTPGNIYRVSLATSACVPTGIQLLSGFESFGMGFTADDFDNGATESLYVASDDLSGAELGIVTVDAGTMSSIGQINPAIVGAELTGTGDGRLFAFYTQGGPGDGGPVAIAQLDKLTARIAAQNVVPGVIQGDAWAFAFWGGDFYMFTDPDLSGQSTVQRYRPSDGSVTHVADWPERIVGAGVSTCAPER